MVHHPAPPPAREEFFDLVRVRHRCRELGLIGVDPEGIGFGNLSRRVAGSDRFVISGSGTGGIEKGSADIFTEVISFDVDLNTLECRGPCPASSEAMTHGTLYRLSGSIGGIIHAHHSRLWEELSGTIPTSDPAVPYGTPAMAHEIERLWREDALEEVGIMVMGGHQGGLIAFGTDLWEGLGRYGEYLGGASG